MTKDQKRIKELEDAIKNHRAQTGHSMCWENDQELWQVLGEKKIPGFSHRPPPWDEFMDKCVQYRKSREGENR